MLRKVISGGQTGVDIAALRAAQLCGLQTGGTMPKGFRTESGSRPAWAKEFGLKESAIDGYLGRTHQNVVDSDATLRIARDFSSPGEQATWKAITENQRPWADVSIVAFPTELDVLGGFEIVARRVAVWVATEGFEVLNVAGNRESTCPGIESLAKAFLIRTFEILKEMPLPAQGTF